MGCHDESDAEDHADQAGGRESRLVVVDAAGLTVGRLATQIATVLMGKHKPEYTPSVDTGDYVIVVNADKVQFSGSQMSHAKHERFSSEDVEENVSLAHAMARRTAGSRRDRPVDKEAGVDSAQGRAADDAQDRLGKRMLDKLKLYSGTESPASGPAAAAISRTI